MTSTPVVLLLKRSGQSSDRPSGTVVQNGEMALSFGAVDPGLYFEDSAGSIRKIGPNHYAATAPNSTPVGLAGNSVGETWVDSSTASYYFKVWNGTTWLKVGAGFADTATSASTANTANSAGSAVMASGAVIASGTILASGSLSASGSIRASGALLASGSIMASGAISASGAILSSGALNAVVASGAVSASGALLASGAIMASGAISASGAILSSGSLNANTASGIPSASIVTTLPGSAPVGTLFYQTDAPSGLFIYTSAGWALT